MKAFVACFILICCLAIAENVYVSDLASAEIRLRWKPSPSAGVSGYYMCWGLASGQTTNRLDVGNVTNTELAGFTSGYTYYFTVVAYSSFGDEAPPSNEVFWTAGSTSRPNKVGNLRVIQL